MSVPAVDYIRQAFFGALSTLGFPDSYNPISDVAAEYGSEISASLTQIIPPEEVTVPGMMSTGTFFQRFAQTTGWAQTLTINTNQVFGHYMQQTTPAQSQISWFPVYLAKGEYEYRGIYMKQLNSAIVRIELITSTGSLADTIISALDMHGASVLNQEASASFTVPSNGLYLLRWYTHSRHAASTSWIACFTAHYIFKMSD